jgi:hypothetical protein
VTGVAAVRRIADAVLYEGYLLYPYTAGATKNRLRWQFGVLGPPGADARGDGEPARMSADFLLRAGRGATLQVLLRSLHPCRRTVEAGRGDGGSVPVPELRADGTTWTTFDEAVEVEVAADVRVEELAAGVVLPVAVPASAEVTPLDGAPGARVVRRREPVTAELRLGAHPVDGVLRVTLEAVNTTPDVPAGRDAAARSSLVGAHVVLAVHGGEFVSLLEAPDELAPAVAGCRRERWFPVLAGPGDQRDLLLVSPIILYDHPAVAPESAGPLYDATEIDEILTLRVQTLTDDEKAAARATDPRAAAVVDRCEAMTAEGMARLHGVLRDPAEAVRGEPGPGPAGVPPPWWDPDVDGAVDPERATVDVAGVPVGRGSTVRLHPRPGADAQDLFYDGRLARVAAVRADVDGGVHVAVVLVDDPGADLHEAYGRHLHFAPGEVEPVPDGTEEAPCAPSD